MTNRSASGNIFYVYEHWRHDKAGVSNGVCFYVGKGSGKRAWAMVKRNAHHKAIQSKLTSIGLAIDIRIVARDLSESDAFALEIQRIADYGRANLANKSTGGEGASGVKHTPETIAKIRESKRANPPTITDEWRRKISEAKMGKKKSAATRERMSKARTGEKRGPQKAAHAAHSRTAALGRKQSLEEIERRRSKIVGLKRTPQCVVAMKERIKKRPVRCISDGKRYISTAEAARFYGIRQGNISLTCQGKRKSVGGLVFAYLHEAA